MATETAERLLIDAFLELKQMHSAYCKPHVGDCPTTLLLKQIAEYIDSDTPKTSHLRDALAGLRNTAVIIDARLDIALREAAPSDDEEKVYFCGGYHAQLKERIAEANKVLGA